MQLLSVLSNMKLNGKSAEEELITKPQLIMNSLDLNIGKELGDGLEIS